jgi:hypothetical protein
MVCKVRPEVGLGIFVEGAKTLNFLGLVYLLKF